MEDGSIFMEILGVKIDNFSQEELFQKIEGFLVSDRFHQIATVNPEFILQTQKDDRFKKILNGCDLNVADGIGIKFAFLFQGKKLKCRMPGIDLMIKILEIANRKNMKIFLATKDGGLSSWQETSGVLKKIFPNVEIDGENIDVSNTKYQIPNTKYDIVFCAFGSPAQEKFLNGLKNGKIKLAMGIGGGFDYLTGKIKRAPKWMRKIGLEWLFRLILEPRYRFKRIWNAVIVFSIKVIKN